MYIGCRAYSYCIHVHLKDGSLLPGYAPDDGGGIGLLVSLGSHLICLPVALHDRGLYRYLFTERPHNGELCDILGRSLCGGAAAAAVVSTKTVATANTL